MEPRDIASSKNSSTYNDISKSISLNLSSTTPPPEKKRKYTSTEWMTLATLAFGNFCIGACVSLQAPFFPAEAEKKGATPTEYGFIFGIYQLTLFVTAPLIGKLVAIVPPKYILNAGVVTVGVTCVIFGVLDMIPDRASFVALAFVVRALEGAGAAALKTSSFTIIASQFSDNIGSTFASLETFLGIGLITGPTLGGALYDWGGYGLPFYTVGVVVLLDAIVIFFVLANVETKECKKSGNLWKFMKNPGILIYFFSIFTSFNYIGYNQATLEPHIRELGLSGLFLGMLFAISGLLYALTAPLWGKLCDKQYDRKLLSLIGCLLIVISLLSIGPAPFFHKETTIVNVIIALALMGLGLGGKLISAFTGSMQVAIEKGFPSDISTYGLISSMYASSQSLGAFSGPSLGGYLLDTIGYQNATLFNFGLELLLITTFILYCTAKYTFKRCPCFRGHVDEKKTLIDNMKTHQSYIEESVK